MGFDLGDIGKIAQGAGGISALAKLWEDVQGKNWGDLYQRIHTARSNNEASGEDLDKVETAAKQAETSGESFPHSLPDMIAVIGKHLPH